MCIRDRLVPGACERVGELIRVLVEAPRDLLVGRIHLQREVGGQHGGRVTLGRIMRVRHGVGPGAALGRPLVRAGRALGQLPIVAEQVPEEVAAPLGRGRGPGDFETAGDGVTGDAGRVLARPAESLLLDGAAFRLRTDQRGITRAVGLAEGVTAGDQSHRLFVVHRHAREGFADVARRGERIRLAVRAFRIDVDQAHLHGAEMAVQLAVAAVALIVQPFGFRTPVDVLLGLPDVGAAAGKAEGLEAHRLEGNVAGENQQVGPGQLAAVFLLDRPQQPTRFVQIGVIRPAVQRRETLLSGAGATASVADAVGTRAVPSHADEQRPVMAEVCRPPLLGVRHQGMQVLDHRVQVEGLEFLSVIKRLAHRVGQIRLLVENPEVELVRPPVPVRGCRGSARKRAFGFVIHRGLL